MDDDAYRSRLAIAPIEARCFRLFPSRVSLHLQRCERARIIKALPAAGLAAARVSTTLITSGTRMTIRVDLVFAAPLDDDACCRLRLAAAALVEVRRCVLSPDRRRATWYAHDVGRARISEALLAAGLSAARISTTLTPEAEAAMSAANDAPYRPLGR